MEYMEILYNEYLKTLVNIPTNTKYGLKDEFNYWLEEKERILPLYEQFLVSFDLTTPKGIIEIDKSEKDSVLPYTPIETKGYLVSKYVKTDKTNKKGIINVRGKLMFISRNNKTDNIVLNYQEQLLDVNHIKNFITQFPIDDGTLKVMSKLMKNDKNVFIGTYGKIKDKNRIEQLEKLYNLKQELSKYLNKNIEGEVTYTKDYYLAAINPKYKYKEKSK